MSEAEQYRTRLDRMVAAVILAHPKEKSPTCILADAEALLCAIDAAVAERFEAVDAITAVTEKLIVALQDAANATRAARTHFGPSVVNQQLATESEPASTPYKLRGCEP